MGLWHVAGAVFLFRWIFRDPKVDLRFLALGGFLPMLVDGIWAATDSGVVPGTRLAAHSLLTAVVLMSGVMVLTKRGSKRKQWMALSVGVFFHLFLDGMWAYEESFLWPLFGWGFTDPGVGAHSLFLGFLDVWVGWAQEVVGLVYLVALGRAHGLGNPKTRAEFIVTGNLERTSTMP